MNTASNAFIPTNLNRTLRKMVPTYFASLRSPSHLANRPRGRRHVLIDSVLTGREYAGRRSFTPAYMDARGSGMRTDKIKDKLAVNNAEARHLMFSAFYRPQIRVGIRNDAEIQRHRRTVSQKRKPVPCAANACCSLRGCLIVLDHMDGKEARFPAGNDSAPRRIRKEHPQISARMREGNSMGSILKSQWSSRSATSTATDFSC